MVALVTVPSQSSIYDARYAGTGYDRRSAVRVLTAEASALRRAVERAMDASTGEDVVSLFDFGYGTGRVTNEFAVEFPERFGAHGRDLRVVAYDVSPVGLRKAAAALLGEHGFVEADRLAWHDRKESGYVAGSVSRVTGGVLVTVVFVHGYESEQPEPVRQVILDANQKDTYLLSTSWYSGLSHIPGRENRGAYFRLLGDLTDPRGELLVAASVGGDLVEDQRQWARRLRDGDVAGYPIEVPGDVMYETELGQLNYLHVFGTDFADLLASVTTSGQHAWIEAIRFPDEEFASVVEERANYDKVRRFNRAVADRPWSPDDYRQVHTAAAIRSGHPAGRAFGA